MEEVCEMRQETGSGLLFNRLRRGVPNAESHGLGLSSEGLLIVIRRSSAGIALSVRSGIDHKLPL